MLIFDKKDEINAGQRSTEGKMDWCMSWIMKHVHFISFLMSESIFILELILWLQFHQIWFQIFAYFRIINQFFMLQKVSLKVFFVYVQFFSWSVPISFHQHMTQRDNIGLVSKTGTSSFIWLLLQHVLDVSITIPTTLQYLLLSLRHQLSFQMVM